MRTRRWTAVLAAPGKTLCFPALAFALLALFLAVPVPGEAGPDDLECDRRHGRRAVRLAQDAAQRAERAGFAPLEHEADCELARQATEGCGGPLAPLGPAVLSRAADARFCEGRWEDAIGLYRRAIEAAPRTSEGFVDHAWHAWERIAKAYREMGDRLGEALALGAVHEAWKDGLIPHEDVLGDWNVMRAADDRGLALEAFEALAEATGSPVFEAACRRIRREFVRDYPCYR